MAAAVLSAGAFLVHPNTEKSGMEDQVNKTLFEFDTADIRSLFIVKYDETSSAFKKLILENSLTYGWRFPSKFNYPVDSDDRLRATATSLTGLIVIGIASEDPNDEQTYGVVEPAEGLKAGQKGVGIKVTLMNREKKEIASAIIGKAVKDQPTQRFIRKPGQRFIYVCEFDDPSVLSTDFLSWIEPKILNFGTQWEIAKLQIDHYFANLNPTIQTSKNYLLDLELTNNQWRETGFVDHSEPAEKNPVFNVSQLDQLRQALGNFEITDVIKKSPGLTKSLEDGKGVPNTFQIVNQIKNYGFFLNDKTSPPELVAAGGKLQFTTAAGVRYELFFGGLIPAGQSVDSRIDQRYVMVAASVDELMFPFPSKPDEVAPGPSDEKPGNEPPLPPADKECEPGEQDKDQREAKRQYQIKLNEREKRVNSAKETADRINKRYSSWFYLIDNQLYLRLMPTKSTLLAPAE